MLKSFIVALGIFLAAVFGGHHAAPAISKSQPAAVAVASSQIGIHSVVGATSTRNSPPVLASTEENSSTPDTITHTPPMVPPSSPAGPSDYVTQDQLTAAVQQATNALRTLLYSRESAPNSPAASGGYTNDIALASIIDQLSGTKLNNVTVNGISGLAASEIPNLSGTYLPLSGGTLTGALTVTGGAVNASGGYDIGGANGITYPFDTIPGESVAIGVGALTNQPSVAPYVNDPPPSVAAYSNTAIGYEAMDGNMTDEAIWNTAVGFQALNTDTSGYGNVSNGWQTLFDNTSGDYNTALGILTLAANTTGSNNVGVGSGALYQNTTSNSDTAVGTNALFTANAANNTAVGYDALFANIIGTNNTAMGATTLFHATGGGNTAFGSLAGSGVGFTGTNNTLVGFSVGGGLTTGSDNLMLGSSVSGLTTGSNNVGIGYNISFASSTASNQLNIQNIIYGTNNSGAGSTLSTGNIGIGTTTPSAKFSVGGAVGDTSGSAYFTGGLGVGVLNMTAGTLQTSGNATIGGCVNYNGGTSGTCLSDERVKQDINPYSSGLQDVIALDPVTYKYNGLAGTPNDGDVRMGLIAQQVELVAPDLVSTTSALLSASDTAPTQLLEVNYGALPFVLINALKEIVAISDEFKSNLIAWLGDAGNGITDIFAGNIHAKDELCVGSTCVTPAQFQAMVAAAGEPNAVGTVSAPASTDATDTPPVISISGENPAIIQVGDTYADLGATITSPQADINLGIHAFVGDTPIEQAVIDTSTPTTYHIYYVASDAAGNTSTSTRTIIVQAASTTTTSNPSTATTTSDTGTGDTATTTSTGSKI